MLSFLIIRVVQQVGIDVNKDELIKALQYDRGQYKKGYNDCIKDLPEKLLDEDTRKELANILTDHMVSVRDERSNFVEILRYAEDIVDDIECIIKENLPSIKE